MSGPVSVLPPGASSGMSDISLRTSCCEISLPLRNAPGGNTDTGPANTYFRGLMQIWWLGFAEPLYGEAGAKAPASLNFLLN